MHYRHRFHAGNFADCIKHVVLCALLRAHASRGKPWCYLETHAGAGGYDLGSADAARTAEAASGIARLDGAAPEGAAEDWMRIIREANPGGGLRRYPGSPAFALALAGEGAEVVLCERVPEVFEELRARCGTDPRVRLHRRDGYEATSLLPPPQKRGLVFVDPPFERPDEFDACADFLAAGLRRFAGGSFAVWYPLKNRRDAARLKRRALDLARDPPLAVEYETGAPGDGRMRGCGVLVVNPPFGVEAALAPALAWLAPRLAQGPKPARRIGRLTPEGDVDHNGR